MSEINSSNDETPSEEKECEEMKHKKIIPSESKSKEDEETLNKLKLQFGKYLPLL